MITGLASREIYKDVVISGSAFENVIQKWTTFSSIRMQQKTGEVDNPTGHLMTLPKRIDTGKHEIERHLCGPKSNQDNSRESGDDQNSESLPLPEANCKSKSASKLTDNASHPVTHQGYSFLAVDGPWHSLPLSSDDEKEEGPYTTMLNTKDSEAEQQMVRDWYDVSRGDAYARIEHDYVNLDTECGSEVFDDCDEWRAYVGSRDSRSKKVRQ